MAETPRSGSTGPGSPRDGAPGSRAQQTRTAHDQGSLRDKIPMEDPAASPLGTDSEATGVREPEGSQPPAAGPAAAQAPGGAAAGMAPKETRPPGHARGHTPRGAERWIWVGGAVGVSLLLGVVLLFAAV